MKTPLLIAIAGLLTAAPTLLYAGPGGGQGGQKGDRAGPRGGGLLKMMDADGDEAVSQDEFMAAQGERATKRFAAVDADESGGISEAEFTAATEKRGQRGEGRPGPRGGNFTPPAFGDLDADGDGSVTLAEMTTHGTEAAGARFEKMDANGDGSITVDEIRQGAAGKKGQRGEGREGKQRGKRPAEDV